jgi:hypothetical protein
MPISHISAWQALEHCSSAWRISSRAYASYSGKYVCLVTQHTSPS